MKNIKIIVITAIVTFGLSIGAQALAVLVTAPKKSEGFGVSVTPLIKSPDFKLSVEEQIKQGYIYNKYTGKKLVDELPASELRLRAIEARLDKLEAKK